MSAHFDSLSYAEEIHVSDRMSEGCDPTVFHRSMLDEINKVSREYNWFGVTICHAHWDKHTRILSLCCRNGDMPATLHLFKKVVAAQKAFVSIEGDKTDA